MFNVEATNETLGQGTVRLSLSVSSTLCLTMFGGCLQGFTSARTSLVEIFLLSLTDQLFISPHSTFSTTAAALSGVSPCLCVCDRVCCAGLLPMTIYNSASGCERVASYEPCSHAMYVDLRCVC